MDTNSSKNQDIKAKLVEREVRQCISSLSDKLWNDENMEGWDEWENLYQYVCPECGTGFENLDIFTEDSDGEAYLCPECNQVVNDEPEYEAQEVFEYWIVSQWLHDKLKEKGEPVWNDGIVYVWGRCTSGVFDDVVSSIASDMEILEGQSNEWKV